MAANVGTLSDAHPEPRRRRERASVQVMVKLTPSQAAGVDRMCERLSEPRRAVTIKRLLDAVIKRSDEEAGGDG
jgi:hypothetical protein